MGRRAIDNERIVMRDGLRCHYCNVVMNVYDKPDKMQQKDPKCFTFEHVVPRSRGGTYGLYNIVGACRKCNNKLGNIFYKCFCGFCQNARARTELKEILAA